MEREFIRKILHHGRRGRRHHSLATTLSRELPQIALCVFLCFMKSTMVQQGPGGEPGDCLSTLRPYSDTGCADLPLAFLGAPVHT